VRAGHELRQPLRRPGPAQDPAVRDQDLAGRRLSGGCTASPAPGFP